MHNIPKQIYFMNTIIYKQSHENYIFNLLKIKLAQFIIKKIMS